MAFDNLQTGGDLPEGAESSDPSGALLRQGVDLAYRSTEKDGAEDLNDKKKPPKKPPESEEAQYTPAGKKGNDEAKAANKKLDDKIQGK